MPALTENERGVSITSKALRDEGASYHYLPPSRFVDTNQEALGAIERVLSKKGLPFMECTTWSTDGFYRETHDKVQYRREEGCAWILLQRCKP